MTRWKARTRASCPRTRCQDTRYLLANEGLHGVRGRARIDHLDAVGTATSLGTESLTDALVISLVATFEAVGRAIAPGAGPFDRQVEHESEVRLQPVRRE